MVGNVAHFLSNDKAE